MALFLFFQGEVKADPCGELDTVDQVMLELDCAGTFEVSLTIPHAIGHSYTFTAGPYVQQPLSYVDGAWRLSIIHASRDSADGL